MELWSDQYFMDQVHRYIKMNISMLVFTRSNRHPTVEEYEEYFKFFVENVRLDVTDYDLGNFESKADLQ